MIESRIRLIPLTEINFPESRQRTEIDFAKVYEYAISIAQHGLMQDIGLDSDTHTLVWGGHRFTAFQLCQDTHSGTPTQLTTHYKQDQLDELLDLLTKTPRHYDHWTKVPAKLIKGASPLLLSVLELSENLNRYDLSWHEKASAVSAIHKQAVADAQTRREAWNDTNTAQLVGCSRELVSQLLQPTRKLAAITNPEVRERAETAAKESKSALSATNAIQSIAERYGLSTKPNLASLLKLSNQPTTKPTLEPEFPVDPNLSLGAQSILCTNFHEWAQTYKGEPFNFIHCDFPYGVDFNKSSGQDSSAALRQVGSYDDNEQIYWDLLQTLLDCRPQVIASSAHVMFWLSVGESKQKKRSMLDATKEAIMQAWPDAHISSVLLIWHMLDAAGLAPDPRREPRRTYEWALKITLGDRPIVKVNNASVSFPKKDMGRVHRSQKYQEVLTPFFSMFVDPSTRMLDPTCGSGTSVLTAHTFKAQHVLGLELDPEMRDSAVKHFNEETK